MGFKKLIDLDLLDRFLTGVKALIPTKTSDLTNDSGFITSAPVTSVNGNTGAVSIRELPSVTSSDNDKVLTVVNGAWAAANPTGGGSVPTIYTSTIPTTGWTNGEDGGVYQNISFSGVTFNSSDPVFIDLNITADDEADDLLMNWDYLVRATPVANSSNMRILMTSEPAVALPVRIIVF